MKSKTLTLPTLLKKACLPVALLALGFAGTGVAQADTTLVFDTLTSTSSTSLTTTSPATDSRGAYTGDDYTESDGTFTRGTSGTKEGNGDVGIAGLRIPTITAYSGIYTLSITEADAQAGGEYLGFDSATSTSGEYVNSPTGPAVVINGEPRLSHSQPQIQVLPMPLGPGFPRRFPARLAIPTSRWGRTY